MEKPVTPSQRCAPSAGPHASMQERIRSRCSSLNILTEADIQALAAGPIEAADAVLHILVEMEYDISDEGKEDMRCVMSYECTRLTQAWEDHPNRATNPTREDPPHYPSESITQQELEEIFRAPRGRPPPALKQLEITLMKLMEWHAYERKAVLEQRVNGFLSMMPGWEDALTGAPAGLPAVPIPDSVEDKVQMVLPHAAPHTPTPGSSSSSTTDGLPQQHTPTPGSSSYSSSPASSTTSSLPQHTPTPGSSCDPSSTLQHLDPASQGGAASSPVGAVIGHGVALTLQEQVRQRCNSLEILTEEDIKTLAAGSIQEVEAILQLLVEVEFDCTFASPAKKQCGLAHYMRCECARLIDAWRDHPARTTELPQEVPPRYPSESITQQELEELGVQDSDELSDFPALKQLQLALMKLRHWGAYERADALAEPFYEVCNIPSFLPDEAAGELDASSKP